MKLEATFTHVVGVPPAYWVHFRELKTLSYTTTVSLPMTLKWMMEGQTNDQLKVDQRLKNLYVYK